MYLYLAYYIVFHCIRLFFQFSIKIDGVVPLTESPGLKAENTKNERSVAK